MVPEIQFRIIDRLIQFSSFIVVIIHWKHFYFIFLLLTKVWLKEKVFQNIVWKHVQYVCRENMEGSKETSATKLDTTT